MKGYHGTSADNLQSILKHGLITSAEKIWNCSLDEVYFWAPEAMLEECDGDLEQATFMAEQRAIESAQCALASAKDCRMVLIEFEIEDHNVSVDDSCPNMELARCTSCDIPLESIISIKVSNDLSLLKGYFMNLMRNNDYSEFQPSKLEEKVLRCFEKAQIYPEDIEDITEWKSVYSNDNPQVPALQ